MLPSMPILFTRESQDAFGNKIEPNASFLNQNSAPTTANKPEVIPESVQPAPKQDEVSNQKETKKTDPPIVEENALENALVKSYYQRVKSRFSTNLTVPTNKFVQFQNLLRNFDPNVETPVHLYKKVEELLGAEHPDVVEDFLLFLKPGQALEVGRFMDRVMLVQMTSFISLLHNTFDRKPTVLRKVLRALSTGLNTGNSDAMKARVLPHFRSHPRVVQAFKSLFPDERPCDSLYETGVDMISESFLTNDKGYDVWEFGEKSENKAKPEATGLDTMYLNGRVFLQHGRHLRPARVIYPYSKEPYRVHARRLTPPQCHISPPDSDEETDKKKIPPKRTRKQTKSPTKKDVNDNTKKDATLSPKVRKAQKTKNGKKDFEGKDKRERKDSKGQAKKEVDAPKPKQAKIEYSNVETRKVDVTLKVESKNVEVHFIEPKKIVPLNNEPKRIAHLHAEPNKIETVLNLETKTIVTPFKVEPISESMHVEPKMETPSEPKIEIPIKVESKRIETPLTIEPKREVKSNDWTRDEDKTMLQVLKGGAGSEKVFGRISELLPHRSTTEIKERFCHVLTLLQQMAGGEVT